MISLHKVTKANSVVLENLFQFFCHDLDGHCEPLPMKDGRYVVENFSLYYTHPRMPSFLIHEDSLPVGFVVVTLPEFSPNNKVHCVQHLFVLKGHRRRGGASATMTSIFNRFPGQYYISQAAENAPSIKFWQALYATLGIEYQDAVEGEGLDRVRVQRFTVQPMPKTAP